MNIRILSILILFMFLFSCKGGDKKQVSSPTETVYIATEHTESSDEDDEEEIIWEFEDEPAPVVYKQPNVRDTLIYGYFKQYDFWGQKENPQPRDEVERMRYLQMYINGDTIIFDGRKDDLGLYKYLTHTSEVNRLEYIREKYPETARYARHSDCGHDKKERMLTLGKAIESPETSTFDEDYAKSVFIFDLGKKKELYSDQNREGIVSKFSSSIFCKEDYYGEVTLPIQWTDFFNTCIKPALYPDKHRAFGYKSYRFSDSPQLSKLIPNKDRRNEIDDSFWHYYLLIHNSNNLTCLLKYMHYEGAKGRDLLMPTLYTIYDNQVVDSLHFNKYLTFTVNSINDIQAVLPKVGDDATLQLFEATIQQMSISPQGKIEKGKTSTKMMRNDEVLLQQQELDSYIPSDVEYDEEEEDYYAEVEFQKELEEALLSKFTQHQIKIPFQLYEESSIEECYGKGYNTVPDGMRTSAYGNWLMKSYIDSYNCYQLLDGNEDADYKIFLVCARLREGGENQYIYIFDEWCNLRVSLAISKDELTKGYKNTFEVIQDPTQGRDAIRVSLGQMVGSKFRALESKVLFPDGRCEPYRIPKM